MNSTSPLEVPEILLMVGYFLDQHEAVTCFRVCKEWHETLACLVWRKVYIIGTKSYPRMVGPDPKSLKNNRRFVQELQLNHDKYGDFVSEYMNLQSLSLCGINHAPKSRSRIANPASLIACNNSLVKLRVQDLQGRLFRPFWQNVSSLPNLTSLYVERIEIPATQSNDFWEACRRLEDLSLIHSSFDGGYFGKVTMSFDHLKSLTIMSDYPGDDTIYLRLVQQCPMLEKFNLEVAGPSQAYEPIHQYFSDEAVPTLKELNLHRRRKEILLAGYTLDGCYANGHRASQYLTKAVTISQRKLGTL
ncbi:hypothetical protein BGZ49_003756, partial [Haplosporangium sp. Z 27]